jgi:hypothetical protein
MRRGHGLHHHALRKVADQKADRVLVGDVIEPAGRERSPGTSTRSARRRSAEFLRKSEEKPFRAADVTQPIRVLILNYFAYELRAALPEPFQRLVDVLHREHDAEVAESVHRGVAVIRDHRRLDETGQLEPAVAVRGAHHGNLDALIAQSSDTSGPFSLDRGPPFELETELAKEIDRPSEVIDDDSYVVHPLERHVSNLQGCGPV